MHRIAVVNRKSPQAFRTISEVAEELAVGQHVLRFWEGKFSAIRPMKRGGGRRYYRPQDVDLLRGIQHLLHNEGYTIKGVQKVIREQGARFVAEIGRGDRGTLLAEAMPENYAEEVGLPAHFPAEVAGPPVIRDRTTEPETGPRGSEFPAQAMQLPQGDEPRSGDSPMDPADVLRGLQRAKRDLELINVELRRLSKDRSI